MSDEDPNEFEDLFRPRFGRSAIAEREPVPSFRTQLARGLRKYGTGRPSRRNPRPHRPARVAVREPKASSRRCVIKARYVPLRTPQGAKDAKDHLGYLERDGVERDGSPGRFYAADENFMADEIRAPMEGEERQFRFMVSPEDTDGLDLSEFTRRLMGQVEKDLGRRLIWAAVSLAGLELRARLARARLVLGSAGPSLSLILAVVPQGDPFDVLKNELADLEIGIEDDVVKAEIHDLEGDGSVESSMNCRGREVDQQSTSCERTPTFHASRVDGTGSLGSSRSPGPSRRRCTPRGRSWWACTRRARCFPRSPCIVGPCPGTSSRRSPRSRSPLVSSRASPSPSR